MNKTPEEMAEEHGNSVEACCCGTSDIIIEAEKSFLAGYEAAKDQVVDVNKMMFCVFCNDTHKGNCAIGKGKNHPAFNFSKIVVKIESSWVSVKDRLPEEDVAVLVYGQVLNDPPDVIGVRRRYNGDQDWKHTWESEDGFIYREDEVTHWMPLPKPPKE